MTKIDQAVAILSRSKRGVTPIALQEKTGMSRRFSRWDMHRVAKAANKRAVEIALKDGSTAWRFADRARRG